MPEKLREASSALAALLLGLAAFLIYCGPSILDPTNIAWLNLGDRAMHTLGWMFFRSAPWGMPPGESPNLGIELSNSIGLVDGLPIFAIPIKLVAGMLPDPFQYWGLWLLTCFMLQSLFGYLLARALGSGRLIALCAACFVLLTPAFLFRVPTHMALSGHFLVLAALWLYVRRPPPLWAWPLLMAVTASIHVYLLAMVLAIWVAAIVQRLWLRTIRPLAAVLEFVVGIGATFLVLWTAGFIAPGSYSTYGYGWYKLNLLWPFIDYGWSRIFPDIPHTKLDYEGMSFLGIGIFALLALALVTGAVLRLRSVATPRWLPLIVMLLLLMLFAFTIQLAFADHEVFSPELLPKRLLDLLSALRSTGRFVWPLLYFITVGIVVLVGLRLRPLIAVPIALAAFAAQAYDSAPAWREFARTLPPPSPVWTTTFQSPIWERAANAGYTRIRAIPLETGFGSDFKDPGYFAVTHHMATDMAYLGRIEDGALAALKAHENEVLATGNFEPFTLYILNAGTVGTAAAHATRNDLLVAVDGRFLFARNGAALAEGLGLDNGLGLVP